MTNFTIGDDIIDSRDIIARIEELHEERETLSEELTKAVDEEDGAEFRRLSAECQEWEQDQGVELEELEIFARECSGYAPAWEYGEALILDTYFEEYARDLTEDLGDVDHDAPWPHSYIDWEKAADALRMDYTAVEIGRYTYWIRT